MKILGCKTPQLSNLHFLLNVLNVLGICTFKSDKTGMTGVVSFQPESLPANSAIPELSD